MDLLSTRLHILHALLVNGEMTTGNLAVSVNRIYQNPFTKMVRSLSRMRLVTTHSVGRRNMINLTKEGREIAIHIQKIKEIYDRSKKTDNTLHNNTKQRTESIFMLADNKPKELPSDKRDIN